MPLIEVIKWQILNRAKGFNWPNPWKIGHWSTQKIKRGVIWEGSLIYEWHACIIHCRIGYIEATRFVHFIIIKEDIIDGITSFFHKFILIRSLFGLNNLQKCNARSRYKIRKFAQLKTLNRMYRYKIRKLAQLKRLNRMYRKKNVHNSILKLIQNCFKKMNFLARHT